MKNVHARDEKWSRLKNVRAIVTLQNFFRKMRTPKTRTKSATNLRPKRAWHGQLAMAGGLRFGLKPCVWGTIGRYNFVEPSLTNGQIISFTFAASLARLFIGCWNCKAYLELGLNFTTRRIP
jgi:hypothetical protein